MQHIFATSDEVATDCHTGGFDLCIIPVGQCKCAGDDNGYIIFGIGDGRRLDGSERWRIVDRSNINIPGDDRAVCITIINGNAHGAREVGRIIAGVVIRD